MAQFPSPVNIRAMVEGHHFGAQSNMLSPLSDAGIPTPQVRPLKPLSTNSLLNVNNNLSSLGGGGQTASCGNNTIMNTGGSTPSGNHNTFSISYARQPSNEAFNWDGSVTPARPQQPYRRTNHSGNTTTVVNNASAVFNNLRRPTTATTTTVSASAATRVSSVSPSANFSSPHPNPTQLSHSSSSASGAANRPSTAFSFASSNVHASASAARATSTLTVNGDVNSKPLQHNSISSQSTNTAGGTIKNVAGHFATSKFSAPPTHNTSVLSTQSRDPAAMLQYTPSASSDSTQIQHTQQQEHHHNLSYQECNNSASPSLPRGTSSERQRSVGKHPRQTSAEVNNMFDNLKLRSQSRGSGVIDRSSDNIEENGQTPAMRQYRHHDPNNYEEEEEIRFEVEHGAPLPHREASPVARPSHQRGSTVMQQYTTSYGNNTRFQNQTSTVSSTNINTTFLNEARVSQCSSYHIPTTLGGGSGALGGRSSSNFLISNGLGAHSISHTQFDEPSVSQDEVATFFASKLITEFREIKELGKGHFGRVILVEELSTGQYFAVKVSSEMISARDEARLKHERNIMYALRGSPHCVTLYNAWVEGGSKRAQLYLQMQWCECGSAGAVAKDRRERNIQWQEEEILVFLAHLALALDAMHAVNIVHVDVKPENVLIDASGNYFLGDFGLSLTLEDSTQRPLSLSNNHLVSASQAGLGHQQQPLSQQLTLNNPNFHALSQLGGNSLSQSMASQDEGDCRYISHDMLNRKEHYKAGDIFALGMSLYELMSGSEVPARGAELHHMRNRSDLKELIQRGYSKPLVDLVLSMIAADPMARPTARQLLHFPLIQPSPDSLQVLSSASSLLQTHIPTVLPAACAQSLESSGSGGYLGNAPSSVLSRTVGDLAASPSVNQLRGGNTTNAYFSPDVLGTTAAGSPLLGNGAVCSTPKQGTLSAANGFDAHLTNPHHRNPFAETPSQSGSGSHGSSSSPSFSPLVNQHGTESVMGANPFLCGGSGVIGQPDARTTEAFELRQLLTPQQLLSVRYHRACMEVAAVVFDLINKAMCGVVPPARARYIQWEINRQQQRTGIANGGPLTTSMPLNSLGTKMSSQIPLGSGWNISPSIRPGTSTPLNGNLRRPSTGLTHLNRGSSTNLLNGTTAYVNHHDPFDSNSMTSNRPFWGGNGGEGAENSIMAAAELSTPLGNAASSGVSFVGNGQQFQTPHRH